MLQLNDRDLMARLENFEDGFVERKRSSDPKKEWLQATVAFANSAPIGYPAVLFIGVRNDGSIEGRDDLDRIQQTYNKVISQAFPPIPTFAKILERGGKQLLAVIIPGSRERPHFCGHSYIRMGSETRNASEQQFNQLIAERNSKAHEILRWKDKRITVLIWTGRGPRSEVERIVRDCNQFFVTFDTLESIPLSRVDISFDGPKQRLKLEIRVPPGF